MGRLQGVVRFYTGLSESTAGDRACLSKPELISSTRKWEIGAGLIVWPHVN